MPTLLLRLAGPMQSWGVQSRFLVRDSGLEPSKSGVVGLICAALGKPRAEMPEHAQRWPTLEQLAALRMGVRVDRSGTLRHDYHTVGGGRYLGQPYGVAKADGSKPDPVVSQRYYLADAVFLVGLEGADRSLLQRIHRALAEPVWPLYLGRRAFVPGAPVYLPDGLRDQPLEEALATYPWLGTEALHLNASDLKPDDGQPKRVRCVIDATPEDGTQVRPDVPISFARRQFAPRYVKVLELTVSA